MKNFAEVNVECISNNDSDYNGPCYDATFNGLTANVMKISCYGKYGCYYTNFYCPSNDKNVCNLDCHDSYSCYFMDISADLDFTTDFISINCSTSDVCIYGNYLKCGPSTTELSYSNGVISCSNPYCCPWETDDFVCQANSTCIIDCSQSYVFIF